MKKLIFHLIRRYATQKLQKHGRLAFLGASAILPVFPPQHLTLE